MSNATSSAVPTSHLVQAVIISPQAGRRGRTQWIHCGPTDASARASIKLAFPKYTIESLVIKPAPRVKKSVNLVEKHDYLMVSAVYAGGRVNLTCSQFGGRKMSGNGQTPLLWAAFKTFMAGGGTIGEGMKELKALATNADSVAEFTAAINAAIAVRPPVAARGPIPAGYVLV